MGTLQNQTENKHIERFKKANSIIQLGNSTVGTTVDGAAAFGKEHDVTDGISGASNLLASGSGTVASGIEIAENNSGLKELNERISALETEIAGMGDSPEKTAKEKELKNLRGKRSELRLGNTKSGTDMLGGLSSMVGASASLAGDKGEKTKNIAGIVSGGLGTFSGGLGMVQAWKKRKRRLEKYSGDTDEDKAKRSSIKGKFWKEMAGGAMGMLGGLLGAGSGIAGLFGDKGKKISGFLGAGSSLLGLGGSLLDMFGGGKKEAAGDPAATQGQTTDPVAAQGQTTDPAAATGQTPPVTQDPNATP